MHNSIGVAIGGSDAGEYPTKAGNGGERMKFKQWAASFLESRLADQ